MKKTCKIGILLGLGLAMSAHAEEKKPKDEHVEMEHIGVTAKRDFVPVYSHQAVTESASLTTDTITKEDIEAIRPKDFYDLFSRAAGATSTYQGRKYMNFLSIRGGDSNAVGVIIDGFYIPSAQSSRILAQFPMDAVESVRIVRDSTSLTLGPIMDLGTSVSAPNQGFVIITTKKGTKLGAGGVAEYGSLNTREFQLYHGNKIGDFNYRLTGTVNGTDGRNGYYNNQKANSILFNGGYDGDTLKVNSTLYYQQGMRNMEHSFTNTTNTSYWGYDPMEALWMAIGINKLWTPNQVTSFTYSHGMLTDTEKMGTSTPANNPNNIRYTYTGQSDYADNYHLWHTSTIGNNTAKVGFQSTHWHEPNGYASWDNKRKEETLIGGYIQDEHRFWGGKLALDGGVRVDDKYIKHGTDANLKPDKQWTAPSIAGSFGVAYKIDDIHKITARFGYSHADTDAFLVTVKNKTLGAEERFKYEIGIEGKYHPAFNPKLTLFYYDIKNYKFSNTTQGTGVNQVTVYDAADVIRKGLEFSTAGSLTYGFSYNLAYSHIEFTDDTSGKSNPNDIFSMLLSHRHGPLASNFSLKYVAPYWNNGFTTPANSYVRVGDFTQLDINSSYNFKISKLDSKVTAYARNLLNEKYQTINGFVDLGTTFGMRMEIGF